MKYLFLAVLAMSQVALGANTDVFAKVIKRPRPCSWYQPLPREHDPLWQCAPLQIEQGANRDHVIEIVFPGSNDVVWYRYPKLQGGERGGFRLSTSVLKGHYLLIKYAPLE